ncbi:reverse transcriptase-like protein, partial [Patescibacteria group bacterium]
NNVAEYKAVILALRCLYNLNDLKNLAGRIVFVLDSELITKQLQGIYKVKNENLRDLYHTVKELEERLDVSVSFKHVVRSKNKAADFLVNRELDKHS